MPTEETLGALGELVQAGKVRDIGLSEGRAARAVKGGRYTDQELRTLNN